MIFLLEVKKLFFLIIRWPLIIHSVQQSSRPLVTTGHFSVSVSSGTFLISQHVGAECFPCYCSSHTAGSEEPLYDSSFTADPLLMCETSLKMFVIPCWCAGGSLHDVEGKSAVCGVKSSADLLALLCLGRVMDWRPRGCSLKPYAVASGCPWPLAGLPGGSFLRAPPVPGVRCWPEAALKASPSFSGTGSFPPLTQAQLHPSPRLPQASRCLPSAPTLGMLPQDSPCPGPVLVSDPWKTCTSRVPPREQVTKGCLPPVWRRKGTSEPSPRTQCDGHRAREAWTVGVRAQGMLRPWGLGRGCVEGCCPRLPPPTWSPSSQKMGVTLTLCWETVWQPLHTGQRVLPRTHPHPFTWLPGDGGSVPAHVIQVGMRGPDESERQRSQGEAGPTRQGPRAPSRDRALFPLREN